MSKRTLVPFDGSDPASLALDEAIEEHGDSEIVVLNVVDLDDTGYGMQGTAAENLHDQAQEEAEELLAEAEEQAEQHGVTVTKAIETGQPNDVILDYAESADIDRIVMGSHGRSGVSKILVGSVAENVVQESPVPVTVVR